MALPKIAFINNNNISVFSTVYKILPEKVYPLTNNPIGLKAGFILILPDNYITLISTDIVLTNTQISNNIIRANLSVFLPKEMIEENYGYIKPPNDNITIIAYSTKMREFCVNYKRLLKRASIILTPSIIALLTIKRDFILEIGSADVIFYKNGHDILHLSGLMTGFPQASDVLKIKLDTDIHEQILKWLEQMPSLKILKQTIIHNLTSCFKVNAAYKSFSNINLTNKVFWSSIFIIFVITMYLLKIYPLQRDIYSYQQGIAKICLQNGHCDISHYDPNKMLLYKIKRLEDIKKIRFNPIEILRKSELIFDEDSVLEGFSLDDKSVELRIKTKDTKTFQGFSSRFLRIFGLRFKTISAVMADEMFRMDLSIDLNQTLSDNMMEP